MDELGKSFPAAESFVDAENAGKGKHINEDCLNCGTKLSDTYCPHCGQKDIPRRQTLGDMLSNFISSFWSYEGKFFLTTKYLFTRPGFLAVEYNAGRRESYYHPARMYVFVSFLFFLLYFSLPDSDGAAGMVLDEEDKKELIKESADTTVAQADTSWVKYLPSDVQDSVRINLKKKVKSGRGKKGQNNFNFSDTQYKTVAAYDSAQNIVAEEKRDGWLKRRVMIRVIELNTKYENKGDEFVADFKQSFNDNFSKVLFYLLPVFALLLKLLYVRRDYYYSEHLVLSIYYYNFFYLAGSLMLLFNLIPDWDGVSTTIFGFWIYLYFLFAMKRMYQQTWGKTIGKFILFSFVFSLFLTLGLVINALATLMLV